MGAGGKQGGTKNGLVSEGKARCGQEWMLSAHDIGDRLRVKTNGPASKIIAD